MTLADIPPWLVQNAPLMAVIFIQARMIFALLDRFYAQQERVLEAFQVTEKMVDVARAVAVKEKEQ